MNRKSKFVNAVFISSLLALSACGKDSVSQNPSTTPQAQKKQELMAGSSNELTGTWVSPCFAFINNEFSTATYIFNDDGKLEVLNQIYFDDDCRSLDSTEHLVGRVAYGDTVRTPSGAKAIDMEIGEKTVRSIYSLNDEKLCFGSQSSPLIEGRPSEIKCSKIFKRL